jgi:hypothetical protein
MILPSLFFLRWTAYKATLRHNVADHNTDFLFFLAVGRVFVIQVAIYTQDIAHCSFETFAGWFVCH